VHDFEKLGAFYLGRSVDPETGTVRDEPLLYDARDLTTHAVCVGMTGSGKTGLAIDLIEEAAIDGVPVIAIDPKGDLGNLLLAFPELRPADFRPWVDERDAARQGRTPDEQATFAAELWRKGLAEWGQGPERIARFAASAERAIYTPGSSAGLPIDVLRSFAAPSPTVLRDPDALNDRVQAATSGLLALLGLDPDPIRSREHILVSNLLDRAWRESRDLDLPGLIRQIQKPPIERVGVLDVESFFPAADRSALAMMINNLLASPGFAAWMEGEPLDVGRLLHTDDGRPRVSILSIAHLRDAERMFFVTLLLNEVLAWVRSQPGSQTLRAILYMDEVFGYFPPTANPPSKTPMLTLLKQARAYGLGVVLATQNPVDLDYKGLSNTGTWFLGRLQTERDKARVIEGLEGASAGAGAPFDRARMERILSGLGSRVFLMNDVHEDEPVLFQTRWTLSYLAGPLTRSQISALCAPRSPSPSRDAGAPDAAPPMNAPRIERPVLPPGVREAFLPIARARTGAGRLVYRPALLAVAQLHYVQASSGVDAWCPLALLAPLAEQEEGSPWRAASEVGRAAPELQHEPDPGAGFAALPASALRAASYARWGRQLAADLYRDRPLPLWQCAKPRAVSRPGESRGEFLARLRELQREERDLALEKLRRRYAPQLARLHDQIATAEQRVEVQREQYEDKKLQTVISIGATVVGALFGRKLGSSRNVGRATTAVRGASRAARERGDVARAEEKVESLQQRLAELEQSFEQDAEGLRTPVGEDPEVEELAIRARKSDLEVAPPVLVWCPWIVSESGIAEPAFGSAAPGPAAPPSR